MAWGRVYYIFDVAFSEKNRKVVTSAMDYMTVTNPCLAFEDIGLTGNNRTDYVKIFNGLTCSSQLGRVGGEQQLSLNTGCLNGIRTAVHELCHIIGFLHEHTRHRWKTRQKANMSNMAAFEAFANLGGMISNRTLSAPLRFSPHSWLFLVCNASSSKLVAETEISLLLIEYAVLYEYRCCCLKKG